MSPRTVNKYLPRPPRSRPRGDLRWSTFLRLHAQGIIACDFLVAVTATFRLLYVFVVIEHHRLHHEYSVMPTGVVTELLRTTGNLTWIDCTLGERRRDHLSPSVPSSM